jgi:hypothetical protein
VFNNEGCQIFLNKDVQLIGEPKPTTTEIGGICRLDLRQETAKAVIVKPTLNLWHRRLGHLEQENLKRLQDMAMGVNLKEEGLGPCVACFKGKQNRAPF